MAIAAVLFLRRAAPVALARQAWLTGLAAGALGSLAFGITCPVDTIAHLGLWHVLPVPLAALAARVRGAVADPLVARAFRSLLRRARLAIEAGMSSIRPWRTIERRKMSPDHGGECSRWR